MLRVGRAKAVGFVGAACILLGAVPAWGQTQSRSGLFGNTSSLGGSFTPGNRSTFGSRSSGLSGAGRVGGAFGGTGVGNMPAGMTGNERFLRDAARRTDDFIGVAPGQDGFVGDVRAGASQSTSRGRSARTGGTNRRNTTRTQGNFRTNQFTPPTRSQEDFGRPAGSRQRAVRAVHQLGFENPTPAASSLASGLQERLQRSQVWGGTSTIAVEDDGQAIVLKGQVATEHQRRLAEQLVRLEPGVRQVRNELVVASPSVPAPLTPSEPAEE